MSKQAEREQRAQQLIHTSVDDCRISIARIRDAELLCELLVQCRLHDMATREAVVRRRIKQVMDAAPEKA